MATSCHGNEDKVTFPVFVAELQTLIPAERLNARIAELAEEIRRDYGDAPIHLVGVLKGCVYFMADLSRILGPNVTLDFCQVSSYGDGTQSSGVVQIRKDLDVNIMGKHVLIVEDIVDTGLTLKHLRELFMTRHPASLKVVALLEKKQALQNDVAVEYVGFEIPNKFVVGYGLDQAERFRNLPYIGVLV